MNETTFLNGTEDVEFLDEYPMHPLDILSAVLTVLNIILGLSGNILTIVVITRNKVLRTAFNIMVVALACFDLYLILGALPIHLASIISRRPPGHIACHVQIFVTIQALVASHLFIPTIAFVRLSTVRRRTPANLTKSLPVKCVVVCTILSLAVAIWYYVYAYELSYRIACMVRPFRTQEDGSFERLVRIFIAISTSVLGFCVVAYTLLCCHVRRTRRTSAVHPPPSRRNITAIPVPRGNIRVKHCSQRALVTLNGIYIILLLFSTFYVGTFVFSLVYMNRREDRAYMDVKERLSIGTAFGHLAKSLVYLHSSFNWIVYMATSQKYRQIVCKMMKPRQPNN